MPSHLPISYGLIPHTSDDKSSVECLLNQLKDSSTDVANYIFHLLFQQKRFPGRAGSYSTRMMPTLALSHNRLQQRQRTVLLLKTMMFLWRLESSVIKQS